MLWSLGGVRCSPGQVRQLCRMGLGHIPAPGEGLYLQRKGEASCTTQWQGGPEATALGLAVAVCAANPCCGPSEGFGP